MNNQTKMVSNYRYTLGLDLGVSSLGASAIDLSNNKKPVLLHTSAIHFDAGVEGDIESGKDASRAAARREKRQPRRQHWRRAHRLCKLFRTLQEVKLLPDNQDAESQNRHELLVDLDKILISKHLINQNHTVYQLLPFVLRAKALDEKLDLFDFGRAIYHLAQHRGYLSNRKTEKDESTDDLGKVDTGIKTLESEIQNSNSRTLGEYFSKIDPDDTRIRSRWTSRKMHIEEFNAIWQAQSVYYPEILNDEIKKSIFDAIFYQRPLKSQKNLIGKCSLESDQKRCIFALPIAQRFRLLSSVNNLKYYSNYCDPSPLTNDQRN